MDEWNRKNIFGVIFIVPDCARYVFASSQCPKRHVWFKKVPTINFDFLGNYGHISEKLSKASKKFWEDFWKNLRSMLFKGII